MTKELIDLISRKEVQEFIQSNEPGDVQKLLLKQKAVLGIPTGLVVNQITGRIKARTKLPLWYQSPGILYPPSLNMEQGSSEATAQFKLSVLRGCFKVPPVVADLTGGFGVDTYFLSQYAKKVHYIEPNQDLLEIARHNHRVLGSSNIIYHHESAESFLKTVQEFPEFLFIDPSRRKGAKKVFKLADSEPNAIDLQSKYFRRAKCILIKSSPLLDLRQGCKELSDVKMIYVVAVENECRELLFQIEPGFQNPPTIQAVDLNRNGRMVNDCTFKFEEEEKSMVHFSTPLAYLFEPNAAILKAGAFKWTAQKYGICKLAVNTHLYTADQSIDNFPGRIFKIRHHVKLDKKLSKSFPQGYANILTRNFPLSVEEIKKKTGLKEGGTLFLICTQSANEKIALVVERVK